MTRAARPRFDLRALRFRAGETTFARGEAYQRGGQVEILALDRVRVVAHVAGTEDYRTVVTGSGTGIGGECSCPAFADRDFCKHMVAVALAANAAGDIPEAGGAFARIRDHLKAKGVDALVEMVVGLAERDPALLRRLELAAAGDLADDRTLEAQLRKAIDAATRTGGYVEYAEARGWAEGVTAALDALAGLAEGRRVGLARGLAEHAIARIERALGDIDDSSGGGGALLHRARDIHCEACRAAPPDPVGLARDLYAREMGDGYGVFEGAAARYAEVLGDAGLAEYRRLATAAWEALPPRSGPDRAGEPVSTDVYRLERILDFFAERAGDVDARIALRAKNLSSPWSYAQLAAFCRAQGREDEALRRAEEGLWIFEDGRPDERLVLLAVDLLCEAARAGDAQAHLWRAFGKAPSLELYARLRGLGGEAARDRAVGLLEAPLAGKDRTPRGHPADLLVQILTQEKLPDAAWASVRRHGASLAVREALARASETSHPREALDVYAERVNRLADAGGNRAYAEAAALARHMGTLHHPAEQAAYIADLRARFGRRRNLVKLLGGTAG